jgi:glutathione S-transferase
MVIAQRQRAKYEFEAGRCGHNWGALMGVVTVHHLEQSRSTRVIWALEELGVDYTLQVYKRHPKTLRAGPEIKAIHPVGRFPVLTIDDVVLAESGAILEHLAEHWGALGPVDEVSRRMYRYWMHFAEGSLMPPILVGFITSRLATAVPFPVNLLTGLVGRAIDREFTTPQIKDLMVAVEGHLKGHPFFAGEDFSMADIQMAYPILAGMERSSGAVQSYPCTSAWAQRMQDRPALKRALKVGGPLVPGA